MKITLDETTIQCIRCKNEDLTYYREPTVNYSNQDKVTYYKYFLLCNSCKRHFAYVRKELSMPYEKETKNGVIKEKPKLCVSGFYDLENQPNYEF